MASTLNVVTLRPGFGERVTFDDDQFAATMILSTRIGSALVASLTHLLLSVLIAAVAGAFVFLVWYPAPYDQLSGGRELFLLMIFIDVICGPLLTLVIFNPNKPKRELWRDLALVAMIQLFALGYGLQTVWAARPLFLVFEVDRFKVVGQPDIPVLSTQALATTIRPSIFSGPTVVAVREPDDENERQKILFESIQGGRDYAHHPEFYIFYDMASGRRALLRSKPLSIFLNKHPSQNMIAMKLAKEKDSDVSDWLYVPVIARQDWVAVLNKQGKIQGFLKGDGF